MIEFVNFLKFCATILITNSHFSDIWPVSAIASGGLVGNVMFLCVSGFLLFNIKDSFFSWFSKRFFRVYTALFVFTLFTSVIGIYPINSVSDAFRLFVYPTNYIFLVWLVVCYAVLYFVVHFDKKVKNFLEIFAVVVFFVWILVYAVLYDKSVYAADNVYEPFILFLYIESVLMGALFKKHKNVAKGFKIRKLILCMISAAVYFGSKTVFSSSASFLSLQIVNQFVLLAALYFVFDLFMSLENFFSGLPTLIRKPVNYISKITLQIYIVQFCIIYRFSDLVFPLNFIVVVVMILISALLLYYFEAFVRRSFKFVSGKVKKVICHAKGKD